MTPNDLAKSGSEHAHQRALFAWAAMATRYGFAAANDEACYVEGGRAYAERAYGTRHGVSALDELYAVPNGGERNKAVASKLRAEGVKSGIPDTHLPVARKGFHSLYIEIKKSGGRLSAKQLSRHASLRLHNNKVDTAFSWQEAVKIIMDYLT